MDYDTSEIIISSGAKHSIFNALMAVLNPGDEVIIPTPYWVSYPDQVNVLGGKSVFVETTDANKFKMTPEQLRTAITDKTKVVILNTPSNPTGMVYTRSELERLEKSLKKQVFWLFLMKFMRN